MQKDAAHQNDLISTKVLGTRRSLLALLLLAVFLPLLSVVMVQQQTIKQYAAATHQVTIQNFTMNPTSLTVNAGDTVTWINQDQDAHDVQNTLAAFGSPLLQKGDSYSFTFTQPGTYEYYCTPHKGVMNGYIITVLPAAGAETATPTTIASAPTEAPTIAAREPTLAFSQPTTAVPAHVGGTASIGVVLSLHGLGHAGDNANPSDGSMSNKTPQPTERIISLIIIDSTGKTIYAPSGVVTYANNTGDFRGTIDLGSKFTTGAYTVKVKMQKYLVKRITTNFTISNNARNSLPAASLIAGDVDDNNILDSTDYNSILACLDKGGVQSNCQGKNRLAVDLNDDGAIEIQDTNLFLREFSVKNGD